MDLMRAKGCMQLRDGETHVVLGPPPLPAATRREPADPDAVAAVGADEALVAEYQAHLYGKQ